jgi:hypothetical protein
MSHGQIVGIIADHTGAVVAGVTSTLGAAAYAAGQIPIPAGVPTELVWAAVTFGPPLTWLFVRGLSAVAAYHREKRKLAAARAQRLLDAGRAIDDDEVEAHLDRAEKHSAWLAALGAARDGDEKKAS